MSEIMTRFEPCDHYWIVGDDAASAWSSARATYVPLGDASYTAWRATSGGLTTRIVSESELTAVLAAHGLRGPVVDLVAYAADARWRRETGGIVVGDVPVETDRQSQAMLTGAHAYVAAHPAATIQWKTAAGFVTLDAATVTALALAVGAHVQASFACEADVAAQIASGSITTPAQIDAAFASI
jgi:hypothetical protein